MKKNVLIIFIIIVVIALVSIIIFKFNTNNDVKKEYCTYLVYNSTEEEKKENLDSVNMVFAFNSENICVDCRMVWTFNTEEIAKENYENWKNVGLSNLKIESNKVAFNADEQIGKTKDEIKEIKFGKFEIHEY